MNMYNLIEMSSGHTINKRGIAMIPFLTQERQHIIHNMK